MKTKLLFLVTVCLCLYGWGQISEYNSMGNTFEFGSGQDPEFIEFNGKLYFISDFNGNDKEYIMSIDGNNNLTIVYDPSSGVGSDDWDIQALTIYNNQLYFALANNTTNPFNYFLYRLNGGIGEIVSVSARVSDSYGGKMVAYNDVLYFAGKENGSVAEIGLISYSPSEGVAQVNTTVPGEDFLPSRFVVGANNTLYFFRYTGVVLGQDVYELYNLDTNSGSSLSTIPPNEGIWYGNGFSPPVISTFGDKLIVISRIFSNGIEEALQISSSNAVSQISGLPYGSGVSSFSFKNSVDHNTEGVIYNNKLALFRASNSNVNSTDFVDDRLVLLSDDGSVVEYDLSGIDGGLDGVNFYGVENGALIFFATGANGEKIYELRETTNDIFPDVRAILPNNIQNISPLFGKVFNDRLYYYGNPLGATNGSLRTLNYYDTRILNLDPFMTTQEELDYFGGLQFRDIRGSIILDEIFGSGTIINDLSPLSSIQLVDGIQIGYTGIQDLTGLENLEVVFGFLEMFDNPQLISLDGLNPDIIFDTQIPPIYNNILLVDFCALQPWAALTIDYDEADWNATDVFGNGYNPTWPELQSPSSCKNETLDIEKFNNEDLDIKITIFPNPVNDILNIESEFNGDYQIIDLNSRIIGYGQVLFGKNKIDTSLLENGLYILKINRNRRTFVTRIIKG